MKTWTTVYTFLRFLHDTSKRRKKAPLFWILKKNVKSILELCRKRPIVFQLGHYTTLASILRNSQVTTCNSLNSQLVKLVRAAINR